MKQLHPSVRIYTGESRIKNGGRGVFAASDIKTGQLIEECPIIYLTEEDYVMAKQTTLRNYHFLNGPENRSAIALGYGSLYNHSYAPNATYQKSLEEGLIIFSAIKDIKSDEEITVNYNYGNPDDKKRLWIKEIKAYEDTNPETA